MINDVSVLVYTNERGISITDLTLPRVITAFENVIDNIYLTANKLPSNFNTYNVRYIDAGVEFSTNGSHYSQTLQYALKEIPEEYILFLCDDYLFHSQAKQNVLENIVTLIKKYNVDYFSFASLCYCDIVIREWKTPDINLKEFNLEGTLYEIGDNYRHLYSVQPCIWKKTSLLRLLESNPNMSLWDMDNTSVRNTKGKGRHLNYETNLYEVTPETALDFNFKNYTINLPPLTYNIDNRQPDSDFYVLDYGEVIRHGKFIDCETNTKRLAFNILDMDPDLKEKVKQFL